MDVGFVTYDIDDGISFLVQHPLEEQRLVVTPIDQRVERDQIVVSGAKARAVQERFVIGYVQVWLTVWLEYHPTFFILAN